METLHFRFAGGHAPRACAARLVGVVASGNLEVLIEPADLAGALVVDVDTPISGFAEVWQAVIADFFAQNPLADTRVSIHDHGATPAIVALRLDQAVQEYIAAPRPEASP